MTNEEYRILIKAKFDEIREKSYYDAEGVKNRNGFIDPTWVVNSALSLATQIELILGQISAYACELRKKIEEEKQAKKRAEYEEIRKQWCNDNKEQEQ